MTQRMRTVGIAICVAAMATLLASYSAAQTGKIDDDLQRAQEILNQLATSGLEQSSRASLDEELKRIEAHEYVVTANLHARAYTAGSGYFPVTVSVPGLLEPPLVGRIEMPKAKSRRAKSQLNPAYATVRVRAVEQAVSVATQVVTSLWVRVDGDVWSVASPDARIQTLPPMPSMPQTPRSTPDRTPGDPGNEADMMATLRRAREILALATPQDEFETTAEYAARVGNYNTLVPELRSIATLRFDVMMTVEDVGRYDAETETFPVVVSKEGLLATVKGMVAIPRSKARSAKRQLNKAWARTQIRVAPATQEALPYPLEVYVHAGMTRWPVALEPVWVEGPRFKAEEGVRILALSPSTPHVASVEAGSESRLRVWDAAEGSLALSVDTGGRAICSTFSPDGRVLAVGMMRVYIDRCKRPWLI